MSLSRSKPVCAVRRFAVRLFPARSFRKRLAIVIACVLALSLIGSLLLHRTAKSSAERYLKASLNQSSFRILMLCPRSYLKKAIQENEADSLSWRELKQATDQYFVFQSRILPSTYGDSFTVTFGTLSQPKELSVEEAYSRIYGTEEMIGTIRKAVSYTVPATYHSSSGEQTRTVTLTCIQIGSQWYSADAMCLAYAAVQDAVDDDFEHSYDYGYWVVAD